MNDRTKQLLAAAVTALGQTPITEGSWNDQILGLLGQIADNVGEAGGAISWTPLTDVSTPVDGGTLAAGGSGYDQETGRFTLVTNGHAAIVGDGYQEIDDAYWVRKPLSELVTIDDPKRFRFEFGIKLSTFPHATPAVGIGIGIVDSATFDGSLGGACLGVRQAGAAQDQVQNIGALDQANINNLDLFDEVYVVIQINDDGSGNYSTQLMISGKTESGQFRTLHTIAGSGTLRAANLAAWQLVVWYYHDAATASTATFACDIAHRIVELETRPFP